LKQFKSENDDIRQLLLLITSENKSFDVLPYFFAVKDETDAPWNPVILQEFSSVSRNGLLSLMQRIGDGHAGVVFKGALKRGRDLPGDLPDLTVAVKFHRIFGKDISEEISNSHLGDCLPDLVAHLIEVQKIPGYEFSNLPSFFRNDWYIGGAPLLFEYVEATGEPVSEFCKFSQVWFGFDRLIENKLFHSSMYERNLVFSKTEKVKISWNEKIPRLTPIDQILPDETDIFICPKRKLVDLGSLFKIEEPEYKHFSYMEDVFHWKSDNIKDKRVRRHVNTIVQKVYSRFHLAF
jgi:hypothetical protein